MLLSRHLIMTLYYREEKCKFKKLQKEVDKMASMMAGLGDEDDEEKSDDEDADMEKEKEKESSDDEDSESEEEESGSDSESDTSESEAEVNEYIFEIFLLVVDERCRDRIDFEPFRTIKRFFRAIFVHFNRMHLVRRRKLTMNHELNGMKAAWQHLKRVIYCDKPIWIASPMKLIKYVTIKLNYNMIWIRYYLNWVEMRSKLKVTLHCEFSCI